MRGATQHSPDDGAELVRVAAADDVAEPHRRLSSRIAALVLAFAVLCLIRGSAPPGVLEDGRARDGITVWHPADGLGAVVSGFGDLWIDDRARERVLRVDGGSGRIRAAIPVQGRVALAAAPRAVWALQSGGGYGRDLRGPLLRIDPQTNTVRARIALGAAVIGFGVQAAGRDVWVWGPRDILRIDGRAGRVKSRMAVPEDHGELTGLTAGARQVVVGMADGQLLRFDARTGRRTVALRVAYASPSPQALRGRHLLFTTSGVVAAVDLAARRVAWERPLGFRAGATLASHGLVWVHSAATHEPGDRVTALRLATGQIVSSQIVPAFGSTGIAVGAGRISIATAGGALLVLVPGGISPPANRPGGT
jgi:PQQ-like domain